MRLPRSRSELQMVFFQSRAKIHLLEFAGSVRSRHSCEDVFVTQVFYTENLTSWSLVLPLPCCGNSHMLTGECKSQMTMLSDHNSRCQLGGRSLGKADGRTIVTLPQPP
jgi:hypothetical protein